MKITKCYTQQELNIIIKNSKRNDIIIFDESDKGNFKSKMAIEIAKYIEKR